MANSGLPDSFIVSVNGDPVAQMTKSELAAVMNYDQAIAKCKTLSLTEDGKEFRGLKIHKLDFDTSLEYDNSTSDVIKFITAKELAATSLGKYPKEMRFRNQFIMELFEDLRSFKPEVHTDILDSIVDFVMDSLRLDYLFEVHDGVYFEELIKSWNSVSSNSESPSTKMHNVFANYVLHHRDGDLDPEFAWGQGHMVNEAVQSWKKEIWRIKDFSTLPQDITAKDFNDYCRYHIHGDSQSCYRETRK
ncbi:hypothetical protein KCU65_g6218, partial [Aureobasidium melanogenum]